MLETIVHGLLHFVESLGYIGIFIMAMIESTFIPVASELTMVPAGYLVYQGKMDIVPVFIASLTGSISGSLINYWLAIRYGRKLVVRLMSEEKLTKIEKFFSKHGAFSVFIGRLMYGVRHYISFPAGLAKMDLKKFCRYTAMGDALWVSTLLTLGYAAGGNEAQLREALPEIKIALIVIVIVAVALYVRKQKKSAK
jgi:membrane protein DedA with SNARE-associated domain